LVRGNDDRTKANGDDIVIDESLKAGKETNSGSLKTEEEAINVDGLSVKEMKDLTDKVSDLKIANSRHLPFINVEKKSSFLKGHVSRNYY
jgi:hypothetical protein